MKKPFLLLFALLLFFSCKKEKSEQEIIEIHPEFVNYIAAYTSGLISKVSPVKIVLQADFPHEIGENGEITESVLRFSPHIKGTTYLENNNTILFIPSEPLPAGEVFTGRLDLAKFIPHIADSLSSFPFQFQVKNQDFSTEILSLESLENTSPMQYNIHGKLITNDIAASEDVEKMLEVSIKGKKLPVQWKHSDNQMEHKFTIPQVSSEESSKNLNISWNGKPIDADRQEEMEFRIPANNSFEIAHVTATSYPEQFIVVNFSQPLDENQFMQGLVEINRSLNNEDEVSYEDRNISNYVKNIIVEGNQMKIYTLKKIGGSFDLNLFPGIKSSMGKTLENPETFDLELQNLYPEVKFVGTGNIIPQSDGVFLPFEAVGLNAVRVEITKIYEKNIHQFFQYNQYNTDDNLRMVGKKELNKIISLQNLAGFNSQESKVYQLDLSKFIQPEKGAIYNVEFSFDQSFASFPCDFNQDSNSEFLTPMQDGIDHYLIDSDVGSPYYYQYYYPDGYDYRERNNPCHASYYTANRNKSRNILSTDLGVIAKIGKDKKLDVSVSNILNLEPQSNAQITAYDLQNQIVGSGKTDQDGFASITLKRKPFLVKAEFGNNKTYVRVDDGSSLSLSNFAVDGQSMETGLAGFIYGERGVWRPGDSIHLSFVINQSILKIPEGQPAVLELKNPDGQIMQRQVNNKPMNGFYTFNLQTYPDARTGNWNAEITLGGMKFYKTLKIETIKPNRLKINTKFPSDLLSNRTSNVYELQALWLSGALASQLTANVAATLSAIPTKFKDFPNFTFDDASRRFSAEDHTIFDGSLDHHGKANISTNISTELLPPGFLQLGLFTKVFEAGGDFSSKYETKTYSPYSHYVGLNIPVEEDYYTQRLETNKDYQIPVASVDLNGNPVSRSNLEVKVYHLKNSWWYNANSSDLAYYVSREYEHLVSEQSISTQNGRGVFEFNIPDHQWGNYFIRVCDIESGHCAGERVWVDWPYGQNRGNMPKEAASILNFKTDKEKYQIGETAKINIPSSVEGKLLISIENGMEVIEKRWENAKDGTTTLEIPIVEEMAPNAFVHIAILQPHAQTVNDLPIRMYGVIPIYVENPDRKLNPVLTTPLEVKPKSDYSIQVKEQNGKPMTYTLAIVDEGLLDITNFKTPDIHEHFNQKQSLGVKTWDIYNYVLGAYGGRIESVFTIGGDMAMQAQNKEKINRFKPVVKFLGPFTIDKNQTKTHDLKMDNYVGSVKVMLVAGNEKAFGSTEKSIPVRQELMTLTTLPRVLNPGDIVQMPVTVFAMDKKIKTVNVQVETNEFLEHQNAKNQTIEFDEMGEKIVNFSFKVPEKIGKATVKVQVSGHGEKADQYIELEVRSPNPPITRLTGGEVFANSTYSASYEPFGMPGTNNIELQLSSLPDMRLGERLNFLLNYPHGCVEQITSTAFPQLFLGDLMTLTDEQKSQIESNIKATLNQIKSHQLSGGGLAYWQGSSRADEWGSSYALHFILKAEEKGYQIPVGLKSGLIEFQKREARHWNYYGDTLDYADQLQVYRLYTLALSGSADLALMNRMREKPLKNASKWQLIATYHLAGQPEIAQRMMANTSTDVREYQFNSYTYGSTLRDQAIVLNALSLTNNNQKASTLMRNMAHKLSQNTWHSTQTTAFALMSISEYVKGQTGQGIQAEFEIDGQIKKVNTQKPVYSIALPIAKKDIEVRNLGSNYLYANIVNTGVSMEIIKQKEQRNLNIQVEYFNLSGEKLNIDNLPQGTDFRAVVTLTHPGILGEYNELALTQIFPSGWEIINTRLNNQTTSFTNAGLDNQDFRDDRVYSYFDLYPNKQIKITTLLNATYAGEFDLPATWVQAMYDNEIYALEPGKRVKVSPVSSN